MSFAFLLTISLFSQGGQALNQYSEPASIMLVNHAPIIIDSNGDFSLQGFPGSGNITDPYKIEGYEIYATSGSHCISITQVTAYYEINDCVFHGSTDVDTAAVYLEDGIGSVSDCEVYNSSIGIQVVDTLLNSSKIISNTTISDFSESGISIQTSNMTLNNVSVLNDGGTPVTIVDSSNIRMIDCSITNHTVSTGYGIFVSDSDAIEITDCSFYGGSNIQFEENVSNITISGCTFTDSMITVTSKNNYGDIIIEDNDLTGNKDFNWGILIGDNESTAAVQNNRISGYDIGIQFQDDSDVIAFNNITGCNTGILVSGNNNTVQNNTLVSNDIGIQVLFGSNNSIYYNWFIQNEISASDSGLENLWDDNSNLGNYYDDFPPTQTGVYNISGSAGSIDRWPIYIGDVITSTTTTTNTSTSTTVQDPNLLIAVSVVGIGVVVLIAVIILKKRS